MPKIHICNTFFESELASDSLRPLGSWMKSFPIFEELQFLPQIYADRDDVILVTELPENPDPRLVLLDSPPQNMEIEDWGPSRAIEAWAKKHRIHYQPPDWEVIKTINSKVFSFTHSPKLLNASLLETKEEIAQWLKNTPGPKVLKTPFGASGRGHRINPTDTNLAPPLIGEPWVPRIQDFSSQWKNKKLLGITLTESSSKGAYLKTHLGPIETWALEEHLHYATPLVEKISEMGYLGHIGIDAFIYEMNGKKKLHPIVEINARKTMSWIALKIGKSLSFTPSSKGLLPTHLGNLQFHKNINFIDN